MPSRSRDFAADVISTVTFCLPVALTMVTAPGRDRHVRCGRVYREVCPVRAGVRLHCAKDAAMTPQ
ncbi:hypothetical protein QQG74_02275 [Micromonospora sp. FIMYZ51]|uniref:hypothetical protein n=1 Tax=Micromonospora sp. FIMYZ51 TaxID=3051832 RepID=UPI00311E2A7B